MFYDSLMPWAHTKGPPSIPSDDALTLDEAPFWKVGPPAEMYTDFKTEDPQTYTGLCHVKSEKYRKAGPAQGDRVLIREMGPNRPDIAHAVSQEALDFGYETESSDDKRKSSINGADLKDVISEKLVSLSMPSMRAQTLNSGVEAELFNREGEERSKIDMTNIAKPVTEGAKIRQLVETEPPPVVEEDDTWHFGAVFSNIQKEKKKEVEPADKVFPVPPLSPAGDASATSTTALPPSVAGIRFSLDCVDCGKSFTGTYRLRNLKRHRAMRHNITFGIEYPCELCSKVFHRQDSRIVHHRIHHSGLT
jgi:hypothetical protein